MQRTGNERTGNQLLNLPVASKKVLVEGNIAAINADGYAEPATKAEGLRVAGRIEKYCDNSLGEDGALTAEVKRGAFVWDNDGSIQNTDILKPCYISDSTTVTITAEGSSFAGIILAVEPDGVTVDMAAQEPSSVA